MSFRQGTAPHSLEPPPHAVTAGLGVERPGSCLEIFQEGRAQPPLDAGVVPPLPLLVDLGERVVVAAALASPHPFEMMGRALEGRGAEGEEEPSASTRQIQTRVHDEPVDQLIRHADEWLSPKIHRRVVEYPLVLGVVGA